MRKSWGFFRFFIILVLLTNLFFCTSQENKPVVGENGMVVSVDEYASRAGIEVLERGGNAVDAAVAVHVVLAVTHPQAGNLGGGGFMVIHMEEGDVNAAIDFREKAPLASHRDMYLDDAGEPVCGAVRHAGSGSQRQDLRHRRIRRR